MRLYDRNRDPSLPDQLHADHLAVIYRIAAHRNMSPEDVMAWAVELLKRYVEAGGEP